jgi:hypothetical protein
MWKAKATSQAPSVGLEVKGWFGESRQGHTTAQLQFSKYSPAICQRVCVEAMRHLHVRFPDRPRWGVFDEDQR